MAMRLRQGLFVSDKRMFEEDQAEHKKIQKLMDKREKEYEERFDEIVRDSANFIYPENYASKVVEAVQNPITGSFSVDMQGEYIGRGLILIVVHNSQNICGVYTFNLLYKWVSKLQMIFEDISFF